MVASRACIGTLQRVSDVAPKRRIGGNRRGRRARLLPRKGLSLLNVEALKAPDEQKKGHSRHRWVRQRVRYVIQARRDG
jgi:hypothetical protein